MLKKLFLLYAILSAAASLSASGNWTLQSKEYTVDTVFHAKIGPGTTQTSLSLTGGSNLKIFYITTDLTNPYVDIRVAQAGSRLTGGAKLSAMSAANTNASTGIEYFAGVNADFFGNSQPIGASVVNSDVYKAPASNSWITWYMNDSKVPGIEQLQFRGTATAPDNSQHAVSAINDGRGADYLVVYNSHYAQTTGTNAYGTEVVLTCDQPISYNGTYTCKVKGTPESGVGSMTIPTGEYVLSGHGTASTFVAGLKDGDTVTLTLDTPLATGGVVTQMAGGMPIILKDGVTLDTQNALDHLTALNPRTAVGYSADRKTLVLLVVDGRSMGGSAGVVSKVLADIMRYVGCSDAMNFDGGGSSELYTRKLGVRNKPSDGNERTVVNSVWAVATAPADAQVAEIAPATPSITLPKYGYYTPSFFTYNQYGVMLDGDFKDVTLSCPPELGEIVDGNTLFANGSGTHALTATYNGVSTEINVTIGDAAPRALLDKVIVDGYRSYTVQVVANVEGQNMGIDNQAFVWSSEDPAIADVTQEGIVSGVANGNTTITASVDENSFSLPVKVEIPSARYIDINTSDNVADWTISKSALSSADLSTVGNTLVIDYKISSSRGPSFTVKPSNPITLYALPDSVRLVINPGTANISKITVTAGTEGERGTAVAKDVDLTPNQTNVVLFGANEFCDTDDMASYPIVFNQVRFDLTGSSGDECHVELPSLATVYTAVQASDGVELIPGDNLATSHRLIKGSNRVARGQQIEIVQSGAWTVLNMSGVIVDNGTGDAIDTGKLSTGHYIVTMGDDSSRFIVI
ncbi:MAG: phosphodiester glycosidase family protein [Muribaculaceae bacterium]|nr:phosphodiester glycosidase family protein [Muribaculaceae bacterium]